MNNSTFAAAGARSHSKDQQLIPPNDSGLRPAAALFGGRTMDFDFCLLIAAILAGLIAVPLHFGAYR